MYETGDRCIYTIYIYISSASAIASFSGILMLENNPKKDVYFVFVLNYLININLFLHHNQEWTTIMDVTHSNGDMI